MPKALEGENDHVLEANLSREALYDVTGKVAVVTGGGSGIGAMIAGGLVANGATVYVVSRKDSSAFALQLTEKGPGKCTAIPADLTKQGDVDKVVEAVRAAHGRLHVLVNNAGANWSQPLEEFTVEGWNKTNDLNVTAVFNMIKCTVGLLKAAASPSDPSRVINIASIDAVQIPPMDTFAYSAGKAAVVHMSEVLGGKLSGEHITVNAILPGAFMSRMMRATIGAAGGAEALGKHSGLLGQRVGTPEDVAGLVLLLSSRAGAWITGTKLVCDGGMLVRPRL